MTTRRDKRQTSRACKCQEQVNKLLKESNAEVSNDFLIRRSGTITLSPPSIVLAKIDSKKRSKLPTLFCSHCPFCGKKYKP
jgi:hypothetical protein